MPSDKNLLEDEVVTRKSLFDVADATATAADVHSNFNFNVSL